MSIHAQKITDLETVEVQATFENEVRSMRHPLSARTLVDLSQDTLP